MKSVNFRKREVLEKSGLINEREAGELLGWSVKTLQSRRYKCQPPKYKKIGRSVRYSISDLEDFINQCSVNI